MRRRCCGRGREGSCACETFEGKQLKGKVGLTKSARYLHLLPAIQVDVGAALTVLVSVASGSARVFAEHMRTIRAEVSELSVKLWVRIMYGCALRVYVHEYSVCHHLLHLP